MQDFEQILESILKIKTESVTFGEYKAKIRTLTSEQCQEAAGIFDSIEDYITFITEHGIVFEDVRLVDHDDFNRTSLIQFWNYFNDENLPETVAREICALSGIEFPEQPEEPEEITEDEMAAMSPNGDPVAE